jgi:hypothetical protein
MFPAILRTRRAIATALGVLTLLSVAALLAFDVSTGLFVGGPHDVLAAAPLILIAVAYVVYQAIQRPPPKEWAKTTLLALAFLFWGANQLSANPRRATLFNDLAIAAFVLDVFLVIIGWPSPAVRTATRGQPSRVSLDDSDEDGFADPAGERA